jgi:hypothetical protein
MSSTVSLTVRSIEQVAIQGGGYGNETVRQMRKIKADDSLTGPFSTLEMVVSPSEAVGMHLVKGANITLQADATGHAVDAIGPDTITEDAATDVLIAGRGFTSASVVQVYDDSDEQIGTDIVPTFISANALSASLNIADAVVGSLVVVTGGVSSTPIELTVEAAA